MRKILTVALLMCTAGAYGQYITIDPDGYTNIREKPNAGSPVIERVQRYEIFFFAGDFCTNDTLNFDHVPAGWMAVTKGMSEPIGYMYRKNIRSFDDLQQLAKQESLDPYKIVFAAEQVKVTLELQPFVPAKHDLVLLTSEEAESVLVSAIDGQHPKGIAGFYNVDGKLTSLFDDGDKEVAGLVIDSPGRRFSIPVDAIKDFYNPRMSVFVGFRNELYIVIASGDGGEAYSIILSVVDGTIRYIRPADFC